MIMRQSEDMGSGEGNLHINLSQEAHTIAKHANTKSVSSTNINKCCLLGSRRNSLTEAAILFIANSSDLRQAIIHQPSVRKVLYLAVGICPREPVETRIKELI